MKRINLLLNYKSSLIYAIVLLTFGFSQNVFSQTQKTERVQQFVNKLNINDWVEFSGISQTDSSILLTEIEVIYGEIEADEWKISGQISELDDIVKTIYILNLPIMIDEKITFNEANDNGFSFENLSNEMMIEVSGSFRSDGRFFAKTIVEMKQRKKLHFTQISGTAKIENIDSEQLILQILGHSFIVSKDVKIKNVFFD